MSNLSEFIGGGKLCYQEFLASGTFTPSTRLLALGGVVLVEAIGGGASGAARWNNNSTTADQGASGGDAGQYVEALVTVTAAVAVTIGAGGVRASAAFGENKDGLSGGATSFGALLTAVGGVCPLISAGSNVIARAGSGARSPGAAERSSADVLIGTTGGRGINGKGGGGAAASAVTATAGVSRATDGGGNGAHSNSLPVADVLGNSATANSGAGGGGVVVVAPTAAFAVKSGAGGTGWLRVTWFE